MIFVWKISQGLVEGYELNFTTPDSRTGRKAVPYHVNRSAPACVRKAREKSIGVKGAQMFNLLPDHLRNKWCNNCYSWTKYLFFNPIPYGRVGL